jgi:hypothetical protein
MTIAAGTQLGRYEIRSQIQRVGLSPGLSGFLRAVERRGRELVRSDRSKERIRQAEVTYG